jgi:uncharacterized membrane protein YqjE
MNDRQAGQPGFFSSLKNLLHTLIGIGRTRLALLGTELEEEKIRLASLFAYGVAALFLLGLGLVILVVLVATAFWDNRLLVLGGFTLLFLGGGFLCLKLAGHALQRDSSLFRASLAELDADLTALEQDEERS